MRHLLALAAALLFTLPSLSASPDTPFTPPPMPLAPGMLIPVKTTASLVVIMASPPMGGEPDGVSVAIYRTQSKTPPFSEVTILAPAVPDFYPVIVKDSKVSPETSYYNYGVWKDKTGSVTSPPVMVKTSGKA